MFPVLFRVLGAPGLRNRESAPGLVPAKRSFVLHYAAIKTHFYGPKKAGA